MELERRDISEALYIHKNPDGDPFTICMPQTTEDRELFALAIGLYMGEGAKNHHTVSMANANPSIHRVFLLFLERICGVNRKQVNVWLNIFDDCDVEESKRWWAEQLGLDLEQFYNTTVRESRGGTYTKKSKHGTLSIAFSNIKLKKMVDDWCYEYYGRFAL
jgi:hypothetical protein